MKKKKKNKKFIVDMVYIVWDDASYEDGNCNLDDLSGLVECWILGWLVKETADVMTIALEYQPDTESWRHVCHIPKSQIKKMKKAPIYA